MLYREVLNRGVLIASVGPIMRITPSLVLDLVLANTALDMIDQAITAFELSNHIS